VYHVDKLVSNFNVFGASCLFFKHIILCVMPVF